MTMGIGEVQYNVNPRFVPDDIPLWLGGSKDSALVYDSANDELTVQTTNASGTLTDRVRIQAGLDAPSLTGLLKVLLADVGASPPAPDSLLHLWTDSATGNPTAHADAPLALETAGNVYLQFLGLRTSEAGIVVSESNGGGALTGKFVYEGVGTPNHVWRLSTNGVERLLYSSGAFAFQEATTISTTAGDLILDPTGDVSLSNNNLVQGTAFHEMGEIADPAAPGANTGRLYVRDNGSGKTQLVVRFPTGAVQVLATEP